MKSRKKRKKVVDEINIKNRNLLLIQKERIVNANIDFKSRFSFYLSKILHKDFDTWKNLNESLYKEIHKYNFQSLLEGESLNEFIEFDLAYAKGWKIIQQFNSDFEKFNREDIYIPRKKVVDKQVSKPKKQKERKSIVLKPIERRPFVKKLPDNKLPTKKPLTQQPTAGKPITPDKIILNRKTNWKNYFEIINRNGIEKLYHFTDEKNLASIISNKGLFSWNDCLNKNIDIPKPGGSQLSRDLDKRKKLENYVRLSFNREHPMMCVAKKDGRLENPVILEISTEVIYFENTKFSNVNATANSASIGSDLNYLSNIKFKTVKSNVPYYKLDNQDKPYFQAEVLVKNHIPIESNTNINTYNEH